MALLESFGVLEACERGRNAPRVRGSEKTYRHDQS
jgi:hypothetical protein